MQHDFDLDEIRKILEQGMAICVLMTNFSADADIRGDSVNALGIEIHDKFHEIFEKLGFYFFLSCNFLQLFYCFQYFFYFYSRFQ